jgi:hypothetical protein
VTAGGRPCAADPSLWKSPPQVINTREIRLRNYWQAEQDLWPVRSIPRGWPPR